MKREQCTSFNFLMHCRHWNYFTKIGAQADGRGPAIYRTMGRAAALLYGTIIWWQIIAFVWQSNYDGRAQRIMIGVQRKPKAFLPNTCMTCSYWTESIYAKHNDQRENFWLSFSFFFTILVNIICNSFAE